MYKNKYMITFCTISNNIDNIKKIISAHNQEIPLKILYYGCDDIDIDNIIADKLVNISIFKEYFNNDYASLWNNIFSRVTTEYIFWFYDTDVLTEEFHNFFISDKIKNILVSDVTDVLSIPVSDINGKVSNVERIIKRSLYPIWKERALPRLSYDANQGKCHAISEEELPPIVSVHMLYEKTHELFDLMFEYNENYSMENLMVYTTLIDDNLEMNKVKKIYEVISNNPNINTLIKNVILYNISCAYFNSGEYMTSKTILSQIDSTTEVPKQYYCYMMGRIYDTYNLPQLALSYYEMVLSENISPLNNIEDKYIYDSRNIIRSTMVKIATLYTNNPDLYKTN